MNQAIQNPMQNTEQMQIPAQASNKAMGLETIKKPTKIIKVKLEAIMTSRAHYSQTVEVPADITEAEKEELIDRIFRNTDGGSFVPDDKDLLGDWQQGECSSEETVCNWSERAITRDINGYISWEGL